MIIVNLSRGGGKSTMALDWLAQGEVDHRTGWSRVLLVSGPMRAERLRPLFMARILVMLELAVKRGNPTISDADASQEAVAQGRLLAERAILPAESWLNARHGRRVDEIAVDDLDDVLADLFRSPVTFATLSPEEAR